MKKIYTKPVLVMENFSLSQSICYNCGANLDWSYATTRKKEDCGWDPGLGDIFFMLGNGVCNVDGKLLEKICYNNPEGGWAIFSS